MIRLKHAQIKIALTLLKRRGRNTDRDKENDIQRKTELRNEIGDGSECSKYDTQ